MTPHFLGLENAATIKTRFFALTDLAVQHAIKAQAMAAFHGDAGLGKTFAVESAIARHTTPGELHWTEFPARTTMKFVAQTLLRVITGVEHLGQRFALSEELIEILSHKARVLVIDEAQRLNRECIEYLRYLHDAPQTKFTLLLVGGNGCWDVLSREPMLRSRIFRRVAFESLATNEVLVTIPNFHPIYKATDPETILFVDDYFTHGNFRDWASFTLSAAELCKAAGEDKLTEAIARNVFALHGGGVNAA
jgi:hypothetical protein